MKRLFTLLFCATLLFGCSDARRDASDEKDPHVLKGLEQMQLKHWADAAEQFQTALELNPELARPDLELALIYHQQKKNYIRAIYHYERYLEKRPDSEKSPLITGWIRQAKISFAAEIGQATGDISEELIRLTRENNMMRQQLERQAGTAPTVTNVKTILSDPPPVKSQPVAKAPAPPAQTPEPVELPKTPAPGSYQVLPGDTLIKISRTVYGDASRWKSIYEANKDGMKSENDLRVGQTLRIPKR